MKITARWATLVRGRRQKPLRGGWVSRRCHPRLERLEDRVAPAAIPLSFDSGPVVHTSGKLTTPNQVDLYAVRLNTDDQFTADVNAQRQGSPLHAALQLFDGNGVPLTTTDTSIGGDPHLTFSVPVSGTYYVGVSSTDTPTGLYSLSVNDLLARFVNASLLNTNGQPLPGMLTGGQP
jgi:hypothetical protein